MATVSSLGVGSGLDASSIISALMAVEKKPLQQLQTQQKDLSTQLSAFGKLQSFASAMRDAASTLSSVLLWSQTTGTSSDDTAVKVSTSSGAATGSYAVSVQQLAARQTVASGAFASATAPIGEGSLTIELGKYDGEPSPTGFTAKTGATPLTVTTSATDTLETLRDKINAAGSGVTASIITDASGARLSLRSRETGLENAFRISAVETNDDGITGSGLSALAFDATAASPMTRYESAANARATINGIAVTSASNTLTNVAEGLTLTLQKTTPTTPVDVTVSGDDSAVTDAMNKFVGAFNDLASYIRDQTKYDAATKTAGTLQGDRTALTLQTQLRAVINEASSASTAWSTLSDVGLSMSKTGTLSLDTTKWQNALANRGELRKLLAADATTTAASGFMDRFRDLGSKLLDTNGAFDSRSKSLQAMIDRNQKSQDAMQDRLDSTQKRLERQYQMLDENMAKLNGLSGYVSQQMAMLNRG